MIVSRVSSLTQVRHEMELPVSKEQMVAWEKGALAQDAFPNLTDGEREFILTGITPDEWATLVEGTGEVADLDQ